MHFLYLVFSLCPVQTNAPEQHVDKNKTIVIYSCSTKSHFILTTLSQFVASWSQLAPLCNWYIFCRLTERFYSCIASKHWVWKVPQLIFSENTCLLINLMEVLFLSKSYILFISRYFSVRHSSANFFSLIAIKILLPATVIRLVFVKNKLEVVNKVWQWHSIRNWLHICQVAFPCFYICYHSCLLDVIFKIYSIFSIPFLGLSLQHLNY